VTKPSAREVWQGLVDEAGDELIAAAEQMSDEDVEKELADAGFDLDAEHAKADAFLDALERGDPLPDEQPVSAIVAIPKDPAKVLPLPVRRKRPRVAVMALVAAATVTVGGALYALTRQADHHQPEPPPLPPPPSSNLDRAKELRKDAAVAYDAKDYEGCLRDLQKAKELDLAGDSDEGVRSLRWKARKTGRQTSFVREARSPSRRRMRPQGESRS
jgi:hypothetical protein